MTPKSIVVLLHEQDTNFETGCVFLRFVVEAWRAGGLSVELVRGTKRFVPADVVIPHIVLTARPEEYSKFMEQYPVAMNRGIRDASKLKISSNLVRPGDAYTGPVIVKTDLNYGGLPEARLEWKARRFRRSPATITRKALAKLRKALTGRIAWKLVQAMQPEEYPVFESMEDVPAEVFENENLVVEKFLPEIAGADYCVRYSYFLGDQEVSFLMRSRHRVVKMDSMLSFEEAPTPPGLDSVRRRLGCDYGKMDYVLRDGKAVVFDVNTTPASLTDELDDVRRNLAKRLAEGIRAVS